MGITIHVAALAMCAADAHAAAGNGKDNTTDDTPVETLTLRESVVNAHFANQNRTALRLAVIDEKQLRDRGAMRTYPELLKGLPSLYATSESGSYGDAKLNIRGFGQENIAILLNGIPISGLVSGGCIGTTGWAWRMPAGRPSMSIPRSSMRACGIWGYCW